MIITDKADTAEKKTVVFVKHANENMVLCCRDFVVFIIFQ